MTIFLNDLDGTDGFSLSTQEPGDRSGFDVSSAGDINGDGLADFLVGAFAAKANFASNPGNGRQVGAAYVVYGRAQNDRSEVDLKSLDGTDGFKIDSGLDQDSLGLSVSGAGDFKGDGLDDIVIRSFGPRANVVFGGANEAQQASVQVRLMAQMASIMISRPSVAIFFIRRAALVTSIMMASMTLS